MEFHRGPNDELKAMPGFFYFPSDKSDLIELTLSERIQIAANGQGNYAIGLVDLSDKFQKADVLCYLDNNNIPTHRRKDVGMPGYGTVPINLFQVN